MQEPGGHVNVAGHQGVLLQRFGAADHGLGHLNGIHAARKVIGHEDDGLDGIGEHGFHLVTVGDHLVNVAGQEHGHGEVNVRQGIAHSDALDDVVEHRAAAFPGSVVYDVETIGPRTVEAAVIFQEDNPLAVAVAEDDPPGHGAEGPLYQAGGDAYPVALGDEGTGFLQQLHRLRLE